MHQWVSIYCNPLKVNDLPDCLLFHPWVTRDGKYWVRNIIRAKEIFCNISYSLMLPESREKNESSNIFYGSLARFSKYFFEYYNFFSFNFLIDATGSRVEVAKPVSLIINQKFLINQINRSKSEAWSLKLQRI